MRTLILALLAALMGCTHTMELKNLPPSPYADRPAADPPVAVGVVDMGGDKHSSIYARVLAGALRTQPGVERVVFPYRGDDSVDVLARLSVRPRYRGSAANFFITFPGFVVLTPWWHGYIYRANPRTEVQLVASTGEIVEVVSWEHEYTFHQSDGGRTWVQLSLLEYGVLALIAAPFHVAYDTDQTREFLFQVEDDYGHQVASRVAAALSAWSPRVASDGEEG